MDFSPLCKLEELGVVALGSLPVTQTLPSVCHQGLPTSIPLLPGSDAMKKIHKMTLLD